MDSLSNESARQVLATSFTTTGPVQSVAHTLTFMDVVKEYFFVSHVSPMCGIPHIDIAGCKGDWEKLAAVISPLLVELEPGAMERSAAVHPGPLCCCLQQQS